MGRPNAQMKLNKKGIRFESSVDVVLWSMDQLILAALKDTSRFLKYELTKKIRGLKGMKKSKRANRATQTWVRKRDKDLQIGFGHNKKGLTGETWYGGLQEVGDRNQPKRGLLRETVYENIGALERIQAQYLKALDEKNPDIKEFEEDDAT